MRIATPRSFRLLFAIFLAVVGAPVFADTYACVGDSMTPDAIFGFPRAQNGDASSVVDVNFAAPLQHVLWGIASSRAFECGEGQMTSHCVFRSSFE